MRLDVARLRAIAWAFGLVVLMWIGLLIIGMM